MIQKIETIPLTGDRVIWNGTNQDEMREVGGYRFTGVWESMAIIVNKEGVPTYMPIGWGIQVFSNGEWCVGPEHALSIYTQPRVTQDV